MSLASRCLSGKIKRVPGATVRAHTRFMTTSIRRRTKMVHRNCTATRPENAYEGYGPRFGEYPVPLMTRRTYALQSESLIDRRESAPNSVWIDWRSSPEAWSRSDSDAADARGFHH